MVAGGHHSHVMQALDSCDFDVQLAKVGPWEPRLHPQDLDADHLTLGIEVQNDSRLDFLGFEDSRRIVKSKVHGIGLLVVMQSHSLLLT